MMIDYWLLWPIAMLVWIAAGWTVFGIMEHRGLRKDHGPNEITLSMFMYTIFSKFPLSIALTFLIVGLFFGILSTHLLWHWCPAGSISAG